MLRTLAVRKAFGGWSPQISRYLLTGGVAWLADFAVFSLFFEGMGVILAQLLARIVGAIVAFFGHKLFVFCEPSVQPATLASQSFRYAALWILSYAVSTLALIGLIDRAGLNAFLSKAVVEAAIVVMNYLIMKTFIFHPRAEGSGK